MNRRHVRHSRRCFVRGWVALPVCNVDTERTLGRIARKSSIVERAVRGLIHLHYYYSSVVSEHRVYDKQKHTYTLFLWQAQTFDTIPFPELTQDILSCDILRVEDTDVSEVGGCKKYVDNSTNRLILTFQFHIRTYFVSNCLLSRGLSQLNFISM